MPSSTIPILIPSPEPPPAARSASAPIVPGLRLSASV
jgi:hypothetical protein